MEFAVEILGNWMEQQMASINLVNPGYFACCGSPCCKDAYGTRPRIMTCAHVAVINRTLAQRLFPNGDAIGHSVKLPTVEDRPPEVFVGAKHRRLVVADRGHRGGCQERRTAKPIKPRSLYRIR